MRLAPVTPLAASLTFDEGKAGLPVGRLAMAGGLAQLEWSREMIAADLPVSALLCPPEPGLHPARGRDFEGLHGFLPRSQTGPASTKARPASRWGRGPKSRRLTKSLGATSRPDPTELHACSLQYARSK